jgi:hypothetical protein
MENEMKTNRIPLAYRSVLLALWIVGLEGYSEGGNWQSQWTYTTLDQYYEEVEIGPTSRAFAGGYVSGSTIGSDVSAHTEATGDTASGVALGIGEDECTYIWMPDCAGDPPQPHTVFFSVRPVACINTIATGGGGSGAVEGLTSTTTSSVTLTKSAHCDKTIIADNLTEDCPIVCNEFPTYSDSITFTTSPTTLYSSGSGIASAQSTGVGLVEGYADSSH